MKDRRWVAAVLGGLAVGQVAAGIALTVAAGWTFGDALDAFVVTNSLMGVSFAVCGAVLAWHRPGNAIGWLFVTAGLGHAATAFATPLGAVLDGRETAARLALTYAAWAWPWSIGLFLPLTLLLFPDGRLPSPRWRVPAIAVFATAPVFVVSAAAAPKPMYGALPLPYGTLPNHADLSPLWIFGELRTMAAFALAIAGLLVRYRRGDEMRRRQLLWLVLATITVLVCIVPWGLVAGTPIVVLFAIPLIPLAVTVAVLRHRLLDIRLVVSRALAWALLSACVIFGYALIVAVLGELVSAQVGRSAVATVVLALVAAPVLPPLQRLVDRAMYGDRRDVARVVSRVGRRLSAGEHDDVAEAVREALRLPYVAVRTPTGMLGEAGDADVLRSIPLEFAGTPVGELVVGLRPGERELAGRDRDVLMLVAAPLAVAIHATRLSADLQASRERIVAAREEERRRLRRDLHDGLGPTLTGVAFAADAAANLADSDSATTRDLLRTMRTQVRAAIGDIRRLVDDLRPPALDELGLVGALRQRTEQLSWRADGAAVRVLLDAAEPLPVLPAATEVAAYRIATEALTNVVRHANAESAVLRLRCGSSLDIEVVDDGRSQEVDGWRPGVGLRAMRERAEELGGTFSAGPGPGGGRVAASLPLPSTVEVTAASAGESR